MHTIIYENNWWNVYCGTEVVDGFNTLEDAELYVRYLKKDKNG